jgi:hypothetical protein
MSPSSPVRRRVAAAALLVAPLAAVVLANRIVHTTTAVFTAQDEPAGGEQTARAATDTVLQARSASASPRALAAAGARQTGEPRVEVIASEPQNHPEAFEQDLAEIEQRGTFYQRAFDRDGRDGGWAGAMEQTVREAYPVAEGVDAVLVSADCRGTLCRLEFRYPRAETRVPHLSVLARQFAELPQAAYTYPDERRVHDRAVVYLARKGAELPRFEASDEPAEESL